MFFINCVFENDMFYYFLRIYDVMKLIMMTYFLLIVYLKMTCFYYFSQIRNFMMTCFLFDCIFENDMFMYIL